MEKVMARPSFTHITVECLGCTPEALNNRRLIRAFLRKAAESCDLRVVQDGIHCFSPQGITGYVLLEESHISIHTWPEDRFALIDVLSCKRIDTDQLDLLVRSTFSPRAVSLDVDTRHRSSAGKRKTKA
jgi:S-adenosylmethionine decarboxylase